MGGPKKRSWIYTALFIAASLLILLFLWNAPPETTKRVPRDENHARLLKMKRKEAERHCEECHSEEGGMPLPKEHPPKYRCLFCHKPAPPSSGG